MRTLRAREIRPETIAMTFSAIFALCLLAACAGGSYKGAGGKDRVEEARVTSPDGQFDAVTTREPVGGVLGGVYWNVFIVPKANAAPKDEKNSLLYAAVLRGQKLVWKQNHLLEVHYDIAHIEEFRNLWGSSELQGGSERKGNYYIEVRLVPTSPDFSFLTPDGGFKPTE
jgi:hypothetical protein